MGGHIGKKHAAAGVLAVAAVLLAAWLFTRPSPLAEIHRSFSHRICTRLNRLNHP